jgi:translation initiation factor 1 (eIF-1/SUI1)
MSLQDKTHTNLSDSTTTSTSTSSSKLNTPTSSVSKSSFFSNNFDSDEEDEDEEDDSDSDTDENTNNPNRKINTVEPTVCFDDKIVLFGLVNGRKSNTYIKGWNISNEMMLEHLQKLKKSLGCNGSIQEKFMYEGDEIKVLHLQGNKVAKVSEYLTKLGVTNVYVKPID